MSQTFQVVRCVNCGQFQNHIVKKASKWACKLCGTKQTFCQIFATGPGADCRKVVQQLNLGQGQIEQTVKAAKIASTDQEQFGQEDTIYEDEDYEQSQNFASTSASAQKQNSSGFLRVVPKERSKWAKYPETGEDYPD